MDFAVPVEQRVKGKRKKRQVLWPCLRTKIAVKHQGDGDTNCKCRTLNGPQLFEKVTERVRNRRTNRDYPDYSIVEIGQNIEKSPGDMRTQTSLKDHQLTLVGKTYKTYNNNNNNDMAFGFVSVNLWKRSLTIVDTLVTEEAYAKLAGHATVAAKGDLKRFRSSSLYLQFDSTAFHVEWEL